LNDFLTSETQQLARHGDLEGLLITGLSDEGLELLQVYVENTSDVQTVSAIILHSLPSALSNEPRAKVWVEAYKSILDRQRLWHQRAQFDMEW